MKKQDIIVDAIGPTWGQDDGDENQRPNTETDNNHDDEASASARPTTNGHRTPQKPLTQQQKTNIRILTDVVNSTEGTLFTFRYGNEKKSFFAQHPPYFSEKP